MIMNKIAKQHRASLSYITAVQDQIKINQVLHWYGNGSTYKSYLIIKFGKNLFNSMFSMLSPNLTAFGSAWPGHDVQHWNQFDLPIANQYAGGSLNPEQRVYSR